MKELAEQLLNSSRGDLCYDDVMTVLEDYVRILDEKEKQAEQLKIAAKSNERLKTSCAERTRERDKELENNHSLNEEIDKLEEQLKIAKEALNSGTRLTVETQSTKEEIYAIPLDKRDKALSQITL